MRAQRTPRRACARCARSSGGPGNWIRRASSRSSRPKATSGTLHGKIARYLDEIQELVHRASLEYLKRSLAAFPEKPLLVTEFGTRGIRGIRGDAIYSEDFQAACIRATWRAILEAERGASRAGRDVRG